MMGTMGNSGKNNNCEILFLFGAQFKHNCHLTESIETNGVSQGLRRTNHPNVTKPLVTCDDPFVNRDK